MSTLGNWWSNAADQAQQFLSNNSTSGITDIPIFGANKAGCQSSSDCASGWNCKGGQCESPSSTGLDTSGCGDPSDPSNPSCPVSNVVGDCTQTGAGDCYGGGGYEACCSDVRCCRYGISGVRCGCGPCTELDLCDGFCSDYEDANGTKAANCDNRGCDECTSCEFWGFAGIQDIYKCQPKPKGAAPCHCERPEEEGEDSNGCGTCEVCEEDGSCSPNDPECDVCAEKKGPCECNPDETVAIQICQNYEQRRAGGAANLQGIADRKWEEECEKKCEDECVEQAGLCSTKTYCTDTGDQRAVCREGQRQIGFLEAAGERCVFCEDCSEIEGGTDCCPLECHCHTDCGPCSECVEGECRDAATCPGRLVYTGTVRQGSYSRDVYFYWTLTEEEAATFGFKVVADSNINYEPSPIIGTIASAGERSTSAVATPSSFCDPEAPCLDNSYGGEFFMMINDSSRPEYGGGVTFGGEAGKFNNCCEVATISGTFKMYPPNSTDIPGV